MGKGFNNYMTKKFFHPSSKDNIKRVWMAQQKAEFDQKKEDEMVAQYRKEQDRDEGEQEVKFEWQRKYNAPREQYAKNDETILDQPFGIEVRNVRCIKCRKWGHVNTDRICPLFGKDLTAEPEQPKTSAYSLLESMRDDGFTLKQSLLGKLSDPKAANEQMLNDEDKDDPEVQFLKSLSSKQKKKLLKKLSKLQQNQAPEGKVEKKKKKKKKNKKKSGKKSKKRDSSDESDSSDEESPPKKLKRKRPQSDSDNSDDIERAPRKNGGIGSKSSIRKQDLKNGERDRERRGDTSRNDDRRDGRIDRSDQIDGNGQRYDGRRDSRRDRHGSDERDRGNEIRKDDRRRGRSRSRDGDNGNIQIYNESGGKVDKSGSRDRQCKDTSDDREVGLETERGTDKGEEMIEGDLGVEIEVEEGKLKKKGKVEVQGGEMIEGGLRVEIEMEEGKLKKKGKVEVQGGEMIEGGLGV
ncbi:CIR1-like protein [Mya arenaria]|uniref:CIR1-like protein n=1 Tax=Mya arenaria TaxID=6604 RepID=A0ABY7DBB5_MYAAR|nr:CIR1-like protein [Mya arenaria]